MLEEIIPADIDRLLEQSFSEGLTQSEIMLRMNCPRKWYFRYVVRAKKQGAFSWALLYGTAIHEMLDEYYRNLYDGPDEITCPLFHFEPDVILTPSQKEEYQYWRRLADVTFQRYAFYWRKVDTRYIIVSTEQEIEVPYRNFRLRGKIDLQINPLPNSDALYIVDHKTVSDYSRPQYEGWNFRFQFLFYAWLYWRHRGRQPAGLLVNGLRKSSLRQSEKKQETQSQLFKRIDRHITEYPDQYFQREKLTFDAHTLERFETFTLDPILTQFEWLQRPNLSTQDLQAMLLAMNSDHCQQYNRPCEFIDLCQNNFKDFSAEYIQMNEKHEELRK